jgi:4-hydroxy-tetrahydrodipicolinate synthase
LKDGFYTALGTPVDGSGSFAPAGFVRQIGDQIAHGASGLLVMGSMGMEPCLRDKDFRAVAQSSVNAAKGRAPLFVGAMDNSVSRVMDRIDSLKGLALDGVVLTAPFYFVLSQSELTGFFRTIADSSPFPIYLYDLPTVVKHKITIEMAFELAEHRNIRGIKTADLALCRYLKNDPRTAGRFQVLFSGMDMLDAAYAYGLRMGLDGMFAMMPRTIADFYKSAAAGDMTSAGRHLDLILGTRNFLMKLGIWRGFAYCMNLLGYEGSFMPDYTPPLTEAEQSQVKEYLKAHRLL